MADTSPMQSNDTMSQEPNRAFAEASLREFEGCDGGDPGSPESPSVWMFGLEFGQMPTAGAAFEARESGDDKYSVEQQLGYRYNTNAFKLLAVAHGRPLSEFKTFAHERQPFVQGSKGFFKGNLYPYACKTVGEWPADAEAEVGLGKDAYRQWCDRHRIPALLGWVEKYRPSIFIGVGLSAAEQFAQVVFGSPSKLQEAKFSAANGQTKRVLTLEQGWKKLIVLPHLSGGSNGLNSDDSLQQAGEMVGQMIRR